ncbi:ABC-F family ATP-binding cassette domain-containing protein [Geomesophilobacter sediminis]|uniref:ABC-F family ATP-binding cassette domain-containing protein n=1 Tax=Geomesophilobacter sediminis TaxID=2798584 RepID=A0A8J7SC77_9BACT|nr:ABC-F family ATP-binding cassette domain-containing protein [Geomesophilobacter sediminis]MBJ6726929.1 ABC-F family ATP-binding cassette domain-containing protein [Geomesophilobacter sediminis]
MNVVDVMGLSKSFGARKILDDVTFAIGEDDRVGIIGANGAGKSTLFGILSGMEDRDGGSIVMKRGASVGYLCQDPVLDEESTVAREIEGGLREIRSAMAAFNEISEKLAGNPPDVDRLLARQGELSVWIEHHGGWNTDHRVAEMMTHLNLPDPNQKIGTLSGGTKRRVALARLLLEAPELLLLDEPTNHLDADTTQWLQEHLKRYPGAVMLITHDRYFLDEVVTRMLELEDGAMTSYQGGYTLYLEQREERLMGEARSRSRLLNLLRNETAWIRRGAKARSTKQKARIDRYQDLKEECDVSVQRNLSLGFNTEEGLGGTILELKAVAKAYDKTLLTPLSFGMKRGDRIGIIGPNGCGKTTLIRMIMGEAEPDQGEIVVGKKTRISYFDQLREVIDPSETIYDFLGEGDYVTCAGQKRHKMGYLEEFLFAPEDRRRPIGTLSGGEKSRLILARLMLQDANLLVLDEPTNDLDIPTLQLLDASLASFPGCVLMVTHDRFFLDKVATGILAFEGGGKAIFYEGNYTSYRERKEALKAEAAEAKPEKREAAAKTERPRKGLNYAEKIELERLEGEIEVKERELAEVEAMLADPASYGSVDGGIAAISARYSTLEAALASDYQRWEELETKKAQ